MSTMRGLRVSCFLGYSGNLPRLLNSLHAASQVNRPSRHLDRFTPVIDTAQGLMRSYRCQKRGGDVPRNWQSCQKMWSGHPAKWTLRNEISVFNLKSERGRSLQSTEGIDSVALFWLFFLDDGLIHAFTLQWSLDLE